MPGWSLGKKPLGLFETSSETGRTGLASSLVSVAVEPVSQQSGRPRRLEGTKIQSRIESNNQSSPVLQLHLQLQLQSAHLGWPSSPYRWLSFSSLFPPVPTSASSYCNHVNKKHSETQRAHMQMLVA